MQRRWTKPVSKIEDAKQPHSASAFSGCTSCQTCCPGGRASGLPGEQPRSVESNIAHTKSAIKPGNDRRLLLTSPEQVYSMIHRVNWPIIETEEPFLLEGRDDVDKPFQTRLKEDFWISIESHCAALGVSKSEWVRVAMAKLLAEEQQWFLNQGVIYEK